MGRRRGTGWRRTTLVAACVALAATVLVPACSGPRVGSDAATVDVVFASSQVYTDAFSACVVTVRRVGSSREDEPVAGTVVPCPGAVPGPTTGEVLVDPGTYVIEGSQWSCPGMPGDCSEDPDDATYREAPRGGTGIARWRCSVRVGLEAGASVTFEARGGGPDVDVASLRRGVGAATVEERPALVESIS